MCIAPSALSEVKSGRDVKIKSNCHWLPCCYVEFWPMAAQRAGFSMAWTLPGPPPCSSELSFNTDKWASWAHKARAILWLRGARTLCGTFMRFYMKSPCFLLLILLPCMPTVVIYHYDKVRLSSAAKGILQSQLKTLKWLPQDHTEKLQVWCNLLQWTVCKLLKEITCI